MNNEGLNFRLYRAPVLWLAVRMSLSEDFIPLLLQKGAIIDMETKANDGTTIREMAQLRNIVLDGKPLEDLKISSQEKRNNGNDGLSNSIVDLSKSYPLFSEEPEHLKLELRDHPVNDPTLR